MDVVTQGLLGAAVAQSGARKSETKLATLIGFLSGLLADADVFIYSARDTLYTIEYHRHFTHSLLFIPAGALIAALLLWPFLKKRLPFGRIYFYCLLGYLLSGTLDAFTSYGTYLYWPFSNERVAWHLVSIVDPVFSLFLLVSVVAGLMLRNNRIARVGLLFCGLYLVAGAWQLHRAEHYVEQLASERGHTPQRLVVRPSLGNIILWRSSYIDQGRIYIDAVRTGFAEIKHYPGKAIAHLNKHELEQTFTPGTVLYEDVLRFNYFSDNFLAWHPDKVNVIGDVRYAMVPDSNKPLWGIEFDMDQGQQHARFVTFRNNNVETRQRFFAMLKGEDVKPRPENINNKVSHAE
ncbi:MAG: metal-dependent hydrolase [Thioalkalispiraceae bacterium]|jgi:inner membrane protein